MIEGTPKFNGIAVGSISANVNRDLLHLEATAGFVDTSTGETHGWTKGEGRVWSKRTLLKLRELLDSMEEDLAKMHLGDAALKSSGATSKAGLDVGGIGEHLNTDPVPQV
jgi:hypothetical protein